MRRDASADLCAPSSILQPRVQMTRTEPRPSWIAIDLLRTTVRHARDGWRRIDAYRRRRWLFWNSIGLIVTVAVALLSVVIARDLDHGGSFAWERPWLERFANEGPLPYSWAIWVETPGNGIFMIPLVATAAGILLWRGHTLRGLSLLGGFALVDAAVLAAWEMWPRARPDFIGEGLATPGSFSSFPSGHVTQTVVVYGLLVYLWSRLTRSRGETFLAWTLFAAVVAAVGFSRLRLGAHWPSDVIAALIIGGVWLTFLVIALERAEKKRYEPQREAES